MNKIIALVGVHIVSFIMAVAFPACNSCGVEPHTYVTENIFVSANRISEIDFSNYQQGEYKLIDLREDESVRYDSFGIDILHELELIALEMKGSSFMGTQAFSCDPYIGYDYVENISITSSEEYLSNYPAGENLNKLMSLRNGYGVHGQDFVYVHEQLTEANLFLTFEVPPSHEATHTFTVTYTIEGGRTISKTLDSVKIKP